METYSSLVIKKCENLLLNNEELASGDKTGSFLSRSRKLQESAEKLCYSEGKNDVLTFIKK